MRFQTAFFRASDCSIFLLFRALGSAGFDGVFLLNSVPPFGTNYRAGQTDGRSGRIPAETRIDRLHLSLLQQALTTTVQPGGWSRDLAADVLRKRALRFMPEPECPVWFDSAMEGSESSTFRRSACLNICFPAETARTGHSFQSRLQPDCPFLLINTVCLLPERHQTHFSPPEAGRHALPAY